LYSFGEHNGSHIKAYFEIIGIRNITQFELASLSIASSYKEIDISNVRMLYCIFKLYILEFVSQIFFEVILYDSG